MITYVQESQLKQLDKRSQQNKVQYESYLKLNSIVNEFSNQAVTDDISKKPVKLTKDVEDDVDFFLDAELSDEEVTHSKGGLCFILINAMQINIYFRTKRCMLKKGNKQPKNRT